MSGCPVCQAVLSTRQSGQADPLVCVIPFCCLTSNFVTERHVIVISNGRYIAAMFSGPFSISAVISMSTCFDP